MTVPGTPASPISPSGSVNLKWLIFAVVATVIVTYLASKVMNNEVTLFDTDGKQVGSGSIKTSIRSLKS